MIDRDVFIEWRKKLEHNPKSCGLTYFELLEFAHAACARMSSLELVVNKTFDIVFPFAVFGVACNLAEERKAEPCKT